MGCFNWIAFTLPLSSILPRPPRHIFLLLVREYRLTFLPMKELTVSRTWSPYLRISFWTAQICRLWYLSYLESERHMSYDFLGLPVDGNLTTIYLLFIFGAIFCLNRYFLWLRRPNSRHGGDLESAVVYDSHDFCNYDTAVLGDAVQKICPTTTFTSRTPSES